MDLGTKTFRVGWRHGDSERGRNEEFDIHASQVSGGVLEPPLREVLVNSKSTEDNQKLTKLILNFSDSFMWA